MKTCDRCDMKFSDVLKALDHKENFKHTYKQMDPAKKAAIVARVERTMGPFLLGYGVQERKATRTEIIIERFTEKPELLAGLPEPNWVG